jgi:hypothetical protein
MYFDFYFLSHGEKFELSWNLVNTFPPQNIYYYGLRSSMFIIYLLTLGYTVFQYNILYLSIPGHSCLHYSFWSQHVTVESRTFLFTIPLLNIGYSGTDTQLLTLLTILYCRICTCWPTHIVHNYFQPVHVHFHVLATWSWIWTRTQIMEMVKRIRHRNWTWYLDGHGYGHKDEHEKNFIFGISDCTNILLMTKVHICFQCTCYSEPTFWKMTSNV